MDNIDYQAKEEQNESVRFYESNRSLNKLMPQETIDQTVDFSNQNDLISMEELKQKIRDGLRALASDPFNKEEFIQEDSHVLFNVSQFVKTLVYHVMFFILLGPLLTLPILYKIESPSFIYNMGFFGLNKITKYTIQQCLACFILTISLMVYQDELIYCNSVELVMASLAMTINVVIIALRYATTTETRFNELRFRRFTLEELGAEYLFAWRDLKPHQVDTEIKHAMIRNEIENLTFNTMFLSKITEYMLVRFTDYDFYEKNKYDEKKILQEYQANMKLHNQNQKKERMKQTVKFLTSTMQKSHKQKTNIEEILKNTSKMSLKKNKCSIDDDGIHMSYYLKQMTKIKDQDEASKINKKVRINADNFEDGQKMKAIDGPQENIMFDDLQNQDFKEQIQDVQSINESHADLDQTIALLSHDVMFQRYSGRLIQKEFFLRGKFSIKKTSHWNYLNYSILHALMPFILTLISDLKYSEENTDKFQRYRHIGFWLYTIGCLYLNVAVFYSNIQFLETGVIDFRRRDQSVKMISTLIEPVRFQLKGIHKMLPLTNFFDKQSLQCWLDMRIICLDFGRRYYTRIQLYATVYIVVYFILSAMFLAHYFETNLIVFNYSQWCPLIMEILNFLQMALYMIHLGVRINQSTEQQIFRIAELRNILDRLLSDWDLIMSTQKRGNTRLMNTTFKLAFNYYQGCLKIKTVEECKKELKESLKVLLSIQERLEKENQYAPISLLKVPMTMNVQISIYTALGSLIVAMLQYKLQIL
eukprot:403352098